MIHLTKLLIYEQFPLANALMSRKDRKLGHKNSIEIERIH